MKRLWPRYVFYYCIFIILHNAFIAIGFYPEEFLRYSYSDTLKNILNSFVFSSGEQMAGALWFVPMYLIGTAFMGCILYWGNRLYHDEKITRYVFIGLCCAVLGVIGLGVTYNGGRLSVISLAFHYEATLLLMPFVFFGLLLSKKKKPLRWATWYGALACGLFLWFIIGRLAIYVEFCGDLWDVLLYYPVALAGLYICIWLAKTLNHINFTRKVLSVIGKATIEIMALHFLCFKLVDLIYQSINHRPISELSGFPYSYDQLRPIYILVGIALPVAVSLGWNRFKPKAAGWIAHYSGRNLYDSRDSD